jgi:UrcA family protein
MRNRALQVAAFVTTAAMARAVGATSAVPPNAEQHTVVVHYQRVDLDSGAGAEDLYQTLSRAAGFACGDDGYTKEIDVRLQLKQCERAAIADAVSGVSSANLTTAYNRHFPYQPLIETERLSERFHPLIILVGG